jgi:uncharacterized protein
MNYVEEASFFSCSGDRLLGLLTKPEAPSEIGIVVVVGGPQYRVGSHRQFVFLSRALAAAGFPVLRFDYRGMGDSEGTQQDFQVVNKDIGAAITHLQERLPSVRQIALWGLCDGASAALLYCYETKDPRIAGLCLLNPWVRSDVSHARTQVKHYYTQRLRQKEFWVKLLSGKVAASATGGLARSIRAAFAGQTRKPVATENLSFQQKMASAWETLDGKILLLLGGNDYTAKEFLETAKASIEWSNAMTQDNLSRHDLPMADHTFSSPASRVQVEELTIAWLVGLGKLAA